MEKEGPDFEAACGNSCCLFLNSCIVSWINSQLQNGLPLSVAGTQNALYASVAATEAILSRSKWTEAPVPDCPGIDIFRVSKPGETPAAWILCKEFGIDLPRECLFENILPDGDMKLSQEALANEGKDPAPMHTCQPAGTSFFEILMSCIKAFTTRSGV